MAQANQMYGEFKSSVYMPSSGTDCKEITNLNMNTVARKPIINKNNGIGMGPIQFSSIIELPFVRYFASIIIIIFGLPFVLYVYVNVLFFSSLRPTPK